MEERERCYYFIFFRADTRPVIPVLYLKYYSSILFFSSSHYTWLFIFNPCKRRRMGTLAVQCLVCLRSHAIEQFLIGRMNLSSPAERSTLSYEHSRAGQGYLHYITNKTIFSKHKYGHQYC
jgi:hypothetical protein